MALVSNLEAVPLKISAGTALSPALRTGGKRLVGIVMPASWTAAGLTFQMSADDGATFVEVQDGTGTALQLTVSAGIFVPIDPEKWDGINNWKIRSGTAAAPVNQTVDATLQAILDTDQL